MHIGELKEEKLKPLPFRRTLVMLRQSTHVHAHAHTYTHQTYMHVHMCMSIGKVEENTQEKPQKQAPVLCTGCYGREGHVVRQSLCEGIKASMLPHSGGGDSPCYLALELILEIIP